MGIPFREGGGADVICSCCRDIIGASARNLANLDILIDTINLKKDGYSV
jgi:hypothetical protein